MLKKILALVFTIIFSICLITLPAAADAGVEFERRWSPFSLRHVKHTDHLPGQCITIKDQNDQIITQTSRQVMVGDEIILPDSRHYEVTKVKDSNATAELIGFDKKYLSWREYFESNPVLQVATDWSHKPVGVYHTHTGESYVPTSGKASEPYEGDIYQVGQNFVNQLEKQNVNVIYYRTPHDPHDSNAYMRSRRTAMGLIKNDPVAIFDIHRDGVPDDNQYRVTIDGEQVAKVRLVIGKQNPTGTTNTDFAKRLMAYAEQVHPGIIKDLYIGRGNYNQDLLSTAVLLEAGTYTNTVGECRQGVALLADAVPVVLGLSQENGGGEAAGAGPIKETERSGWTTAVWLLVITAAAVGGFLFISSGSMEKALEAGANAVREMLGKRPILQERIQKINGKFNEIIGLKAQSKPLPKQEDKDK